MRVENKNLHASNKYHSAMVYPSALSSLILAAQLAGVDVRPISEPPKPIFSFKLDEIGRRQSEAFAFHRVGKEDIGFSAAIGPDAEPWMKLLQKGAYHAAPLENFDRGVDADLPYERNRFIRERDDIRAFPVNAPQSQARVPIGDILERLYRLSAHVELPLNHYALIYENGDLMPASLSLIRRNDQGTFMVTYFQIAELDQVQWFMSVDDVRYGLKIEQDRLVVYSTPAPVNATRIERPFMR